MHVEKTGGGVWGGEKARCRWVWGAGRGFANNSLESQLKRTFWITKIRELDYILILL